MPALIRCLSINRILHLSISNLSIKNLIRLQIHTKNTIGRSKLNAHMKHLEDVVCLCHFYLFVVWLASDDDVISLCPLLQWFNEWRCVATGWTNSKVTKLMRPIKQTPTTTSLWTSALEDLGPDCCIFDRNSTIICVTPLISAYFQRRISQEYVGQHWYLNNQVAQKPKCVCCLQTELWSRDSASSVEQKRPLFVSRSI